jgi:hypothetical protein
MISNIETILSKIKHEIISDAQIEVNYKNRFKDNVEAEKYLLDKIQNGSLIGKFIKIITMNSSKIIYQAGNEKISNEIQLLIILLFFEMMDGCDIYDVALKYIEDIKFVIDVKSYVYNLQLQSYKSILPYEYLNLSQEIIERYNELIKIYIDFIELIYQRHICGYFLTQSTWTIELPLKISNVEKHMIELIDKKEIPGPLFDVVHIEVKNNIQKITYIAGQNKKELEVPFEFYHLVQDLFFGFLENGIKCLNKFTKIKNNGDK